AADEGLPGALGGPSVTKRLTSLWAGAAVLLFGSPAFASFHLMKIEEVVGGVCGDATQQAVQLRMRFAGQNLLGGNARLAVRAAAGANPVVLISFASNVANAAQGDRVLLVSPAFAAAHPRIAAHFTLVDITPA